MKRRYIYHTNKNNWIFLLYENGLPILNLNLYLIVQKQKFSEKRRSYIITVLQRIYIFFENDNSYLDELLLNGDFKTVMNRLATFFEDYLPSINMRNNTYNNNVWIIRDYFLWSINRYIRSNTSIKKVKSVLQTNLIRSNDFFNSFLKRNYDGLPSIIKGFDKIELINIYNLLEKSNHFNRRDCLIFLTFYETGMRLGELLNMKTTDLLTESNRYYLKITYDYKIPNFVDSRFDKPRIKNQQSHRIISLSESIYFELKDYISSCRKQTYKTINSKPQHPFVFTSKFGSPLSKSSIRNLFNNINKLVPSIISTSNIKISPHSLRYSFAYNYLEFLIEKMNLEMERAKDELRIICGWKPSSTMPNKYASKYISEQGNIHNAKRINDSYATKEIC